MLVDGELWRVRIESGKSCTLDKFDDFDQLPCVARLGRVVSGGPAPVARREDRGAAPEWEATVALPDGKEVRRHFRGLTQVFGSDSAISVDYDA